jgi:glycosyltransferase involved in cell wall biosynthesis
VNARNCDITFIGFVTGSGGDAQQMMTLAEAIVASGRTAGIVVPAGADTETLEARCSASGVAFERTPLIVNAAHGARQRLDHAMRLLRSVRSPVVHFHTGYSCLPSMMMAALLLLRFRRSFVTVHGGFHAVQPGSAKARLWAATARHRLHTVVAPSDHGRRYQISLGVPPARAITIYNGVQPISSAAPDRDLARQFGLDRAAPLIVFTSRLDPGKGALEAVRILAGVRSEFPDAHLVFVGSGTLEAEVRSEADRLGISPHVSLLGFRTDVSQWLQLASVWLLPTGSRTSASRCSRRSPLAVRSCRPLAAATTKCWWTASTPSRSPSVMLPRAPRQSSDC